MTFTREVPTIQGRYRARWPANEVTNEPGEPMDDVSYLGDNLAALCGEYVIEATALEWGELLEPDQDEQLSEQLRAGFYRSQSW